MNHLISKGPVVKKRSWKTIFYEMAKDSNSALYLKSACVEFHYAEMEKTCKEPDFTTAGSDT